MVATTYSGVGLAVPAQTAGRKSKSVWARMYTALTESQMKRAERELARYAYLLPRDYERTQLRREDQPFGGW